MQAIDSHLTHPTIVPTPTSLSVPTPATDVNSSGADDPAAMKVAPATSSLRSNRSVITSKDGTKKSSQTTAIAMWKIEDVVRHLKIQFTQLQL